jgi:hypothetical protein
MSTRGAGECEGQERSVIKVSCPHSSLKLQSCKLSHSIRKGVQDSASNIYSYNFYPFDILQSGSSFTLIRIGSIVSFY